MRPDEIGRLTVPQMMWLYLELPKPREVRITSKEEMAAYLRRLKEEADAKAAADGTTVEYPAYPKFEDEQWAVNFS